MLLYIDHENQMNISKDEAWFRVCAVADLADGQLQKHLAGETAVVVARAGDEFRVFPPFCPHMAEPLYESGICKGSTLTCSKHLWQWNILTGEQQGPAERPLLLYPSELRGDEVWAYIEEELTYDFDEEDDDDFEW